MIPIRSLLLVGLGVLALYGVQACASEAELNPQPLPPKGGEPARAPENDDAKKESAGGGSTGAPSAPGAPPVPTEVPDAGSEGGTDAGPG